MFDSIKTWLDRADGHQSGARELEAEAKQFKLPSEALPQVFKYLFFAGLGLLNYRLFAHSVPGAWGVATGIVAMMSETIALYCSHNFSRAAGLFRASLGLSGMLLMAFSLIHGTASILDMSGVASITPAVQWYSHVVAFPLLSGLVGLSVVAITMTHPQNIVRLRQAAAHMGIVTARAEAASELELMRATSIIEQARLDRFKERSRREAEYLGQLQQYVIIEEKKRAMIAGISDPELRASLAREMGIKPPAGDEFPSEFDAGVIDDQRRTPRFDSRTAKSDSGRLSPISGDLAARKEALKKLREHLKAISFHNPGRWFKADLVRGGVTIRLFEKQSSHEIMICQTDQSDKLLAAVDRPDFRARLVEELIRQGFPIEKGINE
jgi:hypothetical protein